MARSGISPLPAGDRGGAPRDRKIRNNVMIGAIPPNFIPTIHLVSLVLVSAHSAIVSAIPALRLVSTLAISVLGLVSALVTPAFTSALSTFGPAISSSNSALA